MLRGEQHYNVFLFTSSPLSSCSHLPPPHALLPPLLLPSYHLFPLSSSPPLFLSSILCGLFYFWFCCLGFVVFFSEKDHTWCPYHLALTTCFPAPCPSYHSSLAPSDSRSSRKPTSKDKRLLRCLTSPCLGQKVALQTHRNDYSQWPTSTLPAGDNDLYSSFPKMWENYNKMKWEITKSLLLLALLKRSFLLCSLPLLFSYNDSARLNSQSE